MGSLKALLIRTDQSLIVDQIIRFINSKRIVNEYYTKPQPASDGAHQNL